MLPKHQWPCGIGTNWWWWALGSLGATRHNNIATTKPHLGMGVKKSPRGPRWLPKAISSTILPIEPTLAFKALWMFGASSWAETRTFTGRCWVCVYQNTLFIAVFFLVWSKSLWISGIRCIHTSEDLPFNFCNSAKWQEIRRLLWCDIWRLSPRSASSVSGRSSWAPHVFPFERCGWPLPSGRMA